MIKLSEIIRTDCYIDCGTNEKLREVVRLLEIKYNFKCDKGWAATTNKSDLFISIYPDMLFYITTSGADDGYPTHHISQIDLNA